MYSEVPKNWGDLAEYWCPYVYRIWLMLPVDFSVLHNSRARIKDLEGRRPLFKKGNFRLRRALWLSKKAPRPSKKRQQNLEQKIEEKRAANSEEGGGGGGTPTHFFFPTSKKKIPPKSKKKCVYLQNLLNLWGGLFSTWPSNFDSKFNKYMHDQNEYKAVLTGSSWNPLTLFPVLSTTMVALP